MRSSLPAVLMLFAPATLAAQPAPRGEAPPNEMATAENIPVEEWIAMADGNTLTYQINGALFALEHYYPRSNRVTLQTNDGRCLEGTWAYEAPHYCFYWENDPPVCFRHIRLGSKIVVIETWQGYDTPATQTVTGVSDTPVTCGVPPIS